MSQSSDDAPPFNHRPLELLSTSEFGRALGGLNEEEVRQLERAGAVFSVQMSGRQRGREYPGSLADPWPL